MSNTLENVIKILSEGVDIYTLKYPVTTEEIEEINKKHTFDFIINDLKTYSTHKILQQKIDGDNVLVDLELTDPEKENLERDFEFVDFEKDGIINYIEMTPRY